MDQSSCHLKAFIAQDTRSRNGSRKQVYNSCRMGRQDEGIAAGCWDKLLRHREPQARSIGSGTEEPILNQISMYKRIKLRKKNDG